MNRLLSVHVRIVRLTLCLKMVVMNPESGARDEIETVLQINGLRYRETGSYGILEGSTKATINLQGSVILTLQPGDYSVVLYWKRLAGSTRPWYSSPSAIDGFAMGRVLAAVGERNLSSLSVYNLNQLKKGASSEWSDVGDSVLQFSLPKASQVTLSYNLPLAQRDNPQFQSWTEEHWSRVESRLVVDGIAYRHLSAYVDGKVRGIKDARASMILSLPGGTHTARLQWQNVDGSKWTSVSFISDHASSYASVFLSVNAWNNDPRVEAPTEVYGREDEQLDIMGISIGDMQGSMDLDYKVTVRMTVAHGVLTLKPTQGITFSSGNGVRNEFLLFSGSLSSVNAILSRITYQPYLNWYGEDTLRVVVTDQSSTGFSPTTFDEASVKVNISSVNDKPQLIVPTTQFMMEDDEVSVFGVSVYDADVRFPVNDAVFEVQMSVISGVISLGSAMNLTFLEGEGTLDQFVRFQGFLYDVNTALFEIKYKPDRDFNTRQHEEQLAIRVIDYNKRDQTISEVSRTIPIEIQSEDDPVMITPSMMFTVTLRGYSIKTALSAVGADKVYARLQVMSIFGKLQLAGDLQNVRGQVQTAPPGIEPSSWLEFSGSAEDTNTMIQSLSYSRSPSFFGFEVVFVSLSHLPDFSETEDSVIQLALKQTDSDARGVLQSVTPSRGQSQGGTKIVVAGSGFERWRKVGLRCQFGPNHPVNASIVSDTEVVCTSPANTKAVYSPNQTFVMVTDGETFYSNPIAFTFESPWMANSVLPASGPSIGGTRVRVAGENFPYAASMVCLFGNASSVARFVSASEIECQAPLVQVPGQVELRLTTNKQEFSRSLAFAYTGIIICPNELMAATPTN